MQDQPVRQAMDPDGAAQIEAYVAKIQNLLSLAHPFHVVSLALKTFQVSNARDDGNSIGSACVCVDFLRTKSWRKAKDKKKYCVLLSGFDMTAAPAVEILEFGPKTTKQFPKVGLKAAERLDNFAIFSSISSSYVF